MDPEDMVMPFGKHRGLLLGEIPHGYLRWVRDEAEAASPQLKDACRQVLERVQRPLFPTIARNEVESATERVVTDLQDLRSSREKLQKVQVQLSTAIEHRDSALREVEDLRRQLCLAQVEVDALRRQVAIGHVPASMGDAIKTWYRKLSMECHPDRGGSGPAMAAINRAHALLKTMLGISS